jgi:Neuraminidase (sialidase)
MKVASSVILVVFVLFAFVGVALAMEMSGQVTAVDAAKSTITLKSGTLDASIDCEDGSIVKDVKVGDMVTVEYKEEGGKKKATKVSPMKHKAPVGC